LHLHANDENLSKTDHGPKIAQEATSLESIRRNLRHIGKYIAIIGISGLFTDAKSKVIRFQVEEILKR
jgi:hypothetical protein